MTVAFKNDLLNSLPTPHFDEAVQIIHLPWEHQNEFAVAVAETLRALFAAESVYIGSTELRTGTRRSIVGDLLAELDAASIAWLESMIKHSAILLDASLEERVPIRHETSEGRNRENPYTIFSRTFTLGNKLGVLIALWDLGILADFFVSFSGENEDLAVYKEFLNRLIPHLEIAVARIWRRDQPPSLEQLLKRLRNIGMTAREVEVLWWLLQGKTNPEIATIMGVSVQTVKNHLGSAYPKLGVENRGAAFVQLSTIISGY